MGLRGAPPWISAAKQRKPMEDDLSVWAQKVNPGFQSKLAIDGSFVIHWQLHKQSDLAVAVFQLEPDSEVS